MAVALQHLRGDARRDEPELLADVLLDERVDVAVVADGAAELADAHRLGRLLEAAQAAPHVAVPQEELHPEGRRLGVHAVRAAHDGRVLVLARLRLERAEELLAVRDQDLHRVADVDRVGGVDHVRRREPVVEPLGVVAERFGDELSDALKDDPKLIVQCEEFYTLVGRYVDSDLALAFRKKVLPYL